MILTFLTGLLAIKFKDSPTSAIALVSLTPSLFSNTSTTFFPINLSR